MGGGAASGRACDRGTHGPPSPGCVQRSAPRSAPSSHAPPSLLAVALRAWAGSGLAAATLAPHLVSTPSAAALPSPPPPPQQLQQQRGGQGGGAGAPTPVSAASLVGAFAPCAVDVAPLHAPGGGWDPHASAAAGAPPPGSGLAAPRGDPTAAAVAAALAAPAGAVFRGAADGAGFLHRPFDVAEVAAGV